MLCLCVRFSVCDAVPVRFSLRDAVCVRFSVRDAVCVCLSVYVMLAESFEFRALLDALKGRGLLETGEYIVLGVDSKHYDSKDPQKYIAGTTRTTECLPILVLLCSKCMLLDFQFALRNRVVTS